MPERNPDRLVRYVKLITKYTEGHEKLLDHIASRLATSLEAFDSGGESMASVRTALESVESGKPLTSDQSFNLEAIIFADLRPAVDVIDGSVTVTHPLWMDLYNDARHSKNVASVMPFIGRLELPGHPRLPYGGTGFVIGEGLVMTNRHVAEIFASGLGDQHLSFRPGVQAGLDLLREVDRPTGPTYKVCRVVMIHPYWDMAILAIDAAATSRKSLKLSVDDARDMAGANIFVVGYPAFDPRNPADVQDDLFRGRYGVKRLQPGKLHEGMKTASFGKLVPAATHDCSTLGGNSGSAVVDLRSGHVVALHFGGRYQDMNYAVPTAALACDARVIDAGVQFSKTPTPIATDWATWWKRADMTDESSTDGSPDGSTDVTDISSGADVPLDGGQITVDLPLRLTISIGTPIVRSGGRGTRNHPAVEDVTEGMKEPWHDSDYDLRKGYDDSFLGKEPKYQVPVPAATKPSVVAPTRDGDHILHYQNFSIVMHAKRRLALFTASNISKEPELRKPEPGRNYTRKSLSGLGENDMERWFIDRRMDERYQLPDVFFTKDRKAFDKGHIVRREDVAWGDTYEALRRANGDTYHVTNCSPQVAGFNQSTKGDANWGDLENRVLAQAASERLCVFAGPVLAPTDEVFIGVSDGGSVLRAKIPSRFWKIVIARVDGGIASFGFVLEQDLSDVQWEFVVSEEFIANLYPISEIESMTGVHFDKRIRQADQYETLGGAELVFLGAAKRGIVS